MSSWPDAVRETGAGWRNWLERHLAWVAAGWLVGVCLLSTRLLVGWVAIERLKRVGVRPIGGDLHARLNDLAGRLQIARLVRLLESALAEIPAVIGCLKPIVLLPATGVHGPSRRADRGDPGARAGPHQAMRLRHQLHPGGGRDLALLSPGGLVAVAGDPVRA